MRLALPMLLLLPHVLFAQYLVDKPTHATATPASPDHRLLATSLHCKVNVTLDHDSIFANRVAYHVEISHSQYAGGEYHTWRTAIRVTPLEPRSPDVFLAEIFTHYLIHNSQGLPMPTTLYDRAKWDGLFWLGRGHYAVRWAITAEKGRACGQESELRCGGPQARAGSGGRLLAPRLGASKPA